MTNSVSGPGNTSGLDQYIHDPYRRGANKNTPRFAAVLDQVQSTAERSKSAQMADRTNSARSSADSYPSSLAAITSNTYDTGARIAIEEGRIINSPGFHNISSEEKACFDSIRPSHYDDNQYQQILKDYDERISLLNPDNLPRTQSGFQLVTRPEPGRSRSTDMIKPPSFTRMGGGILRTDYTMGSEVKTYIPVTEWRLVAGAGDAVVGTVYSQQLPWGFRCYFDRGGGAPTHLGYKEGQFENRVSEYLARTDNISREDFLA